ncbi:hypothetical protein [Bacillus sp. SJS]|uniref:hypothetical protein n=1 Tax=Bacillus sp. SJS TaxID=1423321 RepID=UPI0004DD745C|nr:hypothetical protein [Bacillus sp. SJS]KZZ85086.1 hypothetical protein AS29_008540 [Bacillus sp. SJS]
MNTEISLLILENTLIALLGAQNVYAFLILLTGSLVLDPCENGIHKEGSKRTGLEHVFLIVGVTLFGIGPYIYRKLNQHSWLIKKLIFMLFCIGLFIGSIILFAIIMSSVKYVLTVFS